MPVFASYLLCGVILALTVYLGRRKVRVPLPPGPPVEPIIGHLRVLPTENQVETFKKWGEQYGNVVYLNVLGQSIVLLNSFQSAVDLLDKRSAIYSDRSECTTYKLMGWTGLSSIIHYGTQWRIHRRLLQEPLLEKRCVAYQEIQVREAHQMLKGILASLNDPGQVIERFAAAIIMEIAYGHIVISDDDEYVNIAKAATHAVEAGNAGTSILDMLPWLQYIPRWLPGCSGFTAVSRKWRPAVRRMHDVPFSALQEQMASGNAKQCYTSAALERFSQGWSLGEDHLECIKDTAATLFIAGFDTTWSTLNTFIYAMLLFPDAQRKAQEEIDLVVGSERLPDFSDREALPWHPVFPLGIPHRSIKDDVYNGFYIPEGSLVIPNVIAMNQDEKAYHDPHRFYPDRFMPEPEGYGEKHMNAGFGFGRRICPGRHLGNNTAWIAMASILATFDITNAIDADGKKIVPDICFSETITSRPEPFEWVMRPRSEKATDLIIGQTA